MMRLKNLNETSLRASLSRALQLSNQRKTAAALRILKPLARNHPRSGAVLGSLARAYFETKNFVAAAESFRRVTELFPKSELASVGLFHSLWNCGEAREAFAEMQRFLSVSDSDEYATLLHDLAVEGRLGPRLELAEVA